MALSAKLHDRFKSSIERLYHTNYVSYVHLGAALYTKSSFLNTAYIQKPLDWIYIKVLRQCWQYIILTIREMLAEQTFSTIQWKHNIITRFLKMKCNLTRITSHFNLWPLNVCHYCTYAITVHNCTKPKG